MDNFHPMRFGERLWSCPSWRDVPDLNAVNVMLDPGLSAPAPIRPLALPELAGRFGSGGQNGDRFQLQSRHPAFWRSPC